MCLLRGLTERRVVYGRMCCEGPLKKSFRAVSFPQSFQNAEILMAHGFEHTSNSSTTFPKRLFMCRNDSSLWPARTIGSPTDLLGVMSRAC